MHFLNSCNPLLPLIPAKAISFGVQEISATVSYGKLRSLLSCIGTCSTSTAGQGALVDLPSLFSDCHFILFYFFIFFVLQVPIKNAMVKKIKK